MADPVEPTVAAPAKFVEGAMPTTAWSGRVDRGGAHVRQSVIAHNVEIREGAYIEGSVISPGVRIGRNAVRCAG